MQECKKKKSEVWSQKWNFCIFMVKKCLVEVVEWGYNCGQKMGLEIGDLKMKGKTKRIKNNTDKLLLSNGLRKKVSDPFNLPFVALRSGHNRK